MTPASDGENWPVALGDARLHAADAALLRPNRWLNDAVISYCFERLSRELGASNVMLLEPAITYTAAVLQSPDVLREMLSVQRVQGLPSIAEELASKACATTALSAPKSETEPEIEYEICCCWQAVALLPNARGGLIAHCTGSRDRPFDSSSLVRAAA